MVGVTKIGRGNAKYWIEAVAEGGEDYYAKPGERPGEWIGGLAAGIGLDGEVDRDAYFHLLSGEHPLDGRTMVRRPPPRVFVDASGRTRKKEPILGHDVRFSAPKSVSLLWAIGSPEAQREVEEAVDHAVRAAYAHLEREACFVQRGKGGTAIERGAGFVGMAFLHRSSRAGDPALHVHVVTANMTRAVSDGKWLSLANPRRQNPLLREAKSTGYVFQAELRAELTRRLAVRWGPVVNGHADLEGIPRPVIDHFSRRRAEIVEEMERRGTSSAAAAEVAAYRTRDAKDYEVDPDRQRADWRAAAAEFDLTEANIARRVGGARRRDPRPIGPRDLDAALGSLEATHSHFDRRDLLCAIADRMGEGAIVDELERAVEQVLAGEQVVCVHRGEGLLGTSYFTTPRLWEMEEKVMRSADEGEDAGAAVVGPPILEKVLALHPYLGDEQAEMVRRITAGGERIVTVAARPGTGKTTALKAAREAWSEAGVRGIGVATARSASGELADAGVPSMSITALLIRCEEARSRGHRPLPAGTVIVMDESSTTSTPHMAALVELVEECGGKLVLIGDPRQIGAVGPGGLYGRLTTIAEPAVLTQIRRQRNPDDRRIVELAHEGRGSDALDLLRVRDRLVIADTLEESLDAMALDWHHSFAAGEDAMMIARRVRDVAELNARARDLLRAEGRLAGPSVTVGGEDFALGDRLVTRVNNREVSNRERWEVIGVDADVSHLMLQRIGGDGRTVVLAPGYLERRADNGDPAVQHAYASTTYGMQSRTVDSAFSLADAGIAREDFLVAVSRARGATTVYGVAASELLDADLGPGTREVDDLAHDIRVGAERVAAEFSAGEVGDRKRIEATPEDELARRRRQLLLEREHTAPRHRGDDRRLAEIDTRIAELQHPVAADTDGPIRQPRLAASAERMATEQVGRLRAERAAIAERGEGRQPSKSTVGQSEQVELALIEDRLLELRRRQVRAERISPSQRIVDALGPRPQDPLPAALWNEGVDVIVTHRQLHGVIEEGPHPLGPRPTAAEDRNAHVDAERRLRRVQEALHRTRTRELGQAAELSR
jgi:conjugative relaxase-like TrwC/TraI family protein